MVSIRQIKERFEDITNLWFGSRGMEANLAPNKPIYAKISKTYFLWLRYSPGEFQATLISKKYLSDPRSFIWKHELKYFFF